MFVYLWNLCKFVLLRITAISWNVVIKLVKGEQQQQVNNTAKGKVNMAVEVWTDVLSFVKRVELAEVSLTNCQILNICWPRLHGNKVMPHEVREMIIASRGQPPTAILQIEEHRKEVPFANCPPPDYITGFHKIQITFLDDQVLAFIKVITPHLTRIDLQFLIQMENLDEQKRGFINQLFKIFGEEKSPNTAISVFTMLGNIQFLPDMDNKTRRIGLAVDAVTDIPLLMNWLATPRSDGQQHVIKLFFGARNLRNRLAMGMVDVIRQDFLTSSRPLPQPFYIRYYSSYTPAPPPNMTISVEENAQTDETLTISHNTDGTWLVKLYRHPKGEHEKWAEDARTRTEAMGNNGLETHIRIDLL